MDKTIVLEGITSFSNDDLITSAAQFKRVTGYEFGDVFN